MTKEQRQENMAKARASMTYEQQVANMAKARAARGHRQPVANTVKHHYQNEDIHQPKLTSIGQYLKPLPAGIRAQIRLKFRDRVKELALDTPYYLNDDFRKILEQCIFQVADDLENAAQHPTELSRLIHDCRCNVEADIQEYRDAF